MCVKCTDSEELRAGKFLTNDLCVPKDALRDGPHNANINGPTPTALLWCQSCTVRLIAFVHTRS
jgi:hypothetical protein